MSLIMSVKNTILSTLLYTSLASATTHRIEVGNGALTFNPNSTVAAVGDVLEFVYYPKNHSVVQSTFQNPCRSQSGFFSGFVPVSSGSSSTSFRVTVNDTKPIWFYCSQAGAGGHCAKGMVGCANCPTTGNTLDVFRTNAMKTDNTTVTQPAQIAGGIFAPADQAGSSTTSSGSTSTTSGYGYGYGSGSGSESSSTSSSATTTSSTGTRTSSPSSSSSSSSPSSGATSTIDMAIINMNKWILIGFGLGAGLGGGSVLFM